MKPKNQSQNPVEIGLDDMNAAGKNSSNDAASNYASLDERFRGVNNDKAGYLRDLTNYFTPKSRNKEAVIFLTEIIDKRNDNFLRQARQNIFFIFDLTEKNGLTKSFEEAFLFLLKKIPETEFTPTEILRILKKLSEFINHLQHLYNQANVNKKCIDAINDAFYQLKIRVANNPDTDIVSEIIHEIEQEVESKEDARQRTDFINNGSYTASLFSWTYQGDEIDKIIQTARAEICTKIKIVINKYMGSGFCLQDLYSRTSFNLLDEGHLNIMIHMTTISPDQFQKLISYLNQLKESNLISIHRTPFFERFHIGHTTASRKIGEIIEALEFGYQNFGRKYLVSEQAPATPIPSILFLVPP